MLCGEALRIAQQAKLAKNYERVEVIARQVISQVPAFVEPYTLLFDCLSLSARYDELASTADSCLKHNPRFIPALLSLSVAKRHMQQHDDAKALVEKAIKLDPSNARIRNHLGVIHKEKGDLDLALLEFDRCLAIDPSYVDARWNSADLRKSVSSTDVEAMSNLLSNPKITEASKVKLYFSLARAYEKREDYAESFSCLNAGSALKRKTLDFDLESELNEMTRARSIFTRELLSANNTIETEGAASQPIFVCGLPRSGTTLVEQILSSHTEIIAADEINDLMHATATTLRRHGVAGEFPEWVPDLPVSAWQQIAASYMASTRKYQGRTYFTDKMLANYKAIGIIQMAFPKAKIVHCSRNPLDTMLGGFRQLFRDGLAFTYDLQEFVEVYKAYRALMAHWEEVLPGVIYTVNYADLVNHFEQETQALIDYIGLPWQADCLSFHLNKRAVRTTSAVQVRSPLFKDGLDTWKKYQSELAPYAEQLTDYL